MPFSYNENHIRYHLSFLTLMNPFIFPSILFSTFIFCVCVCVCVQVCMRVCACVCPKRVLLGLFIETWAPYWGPHHWGKCLPLPISHYLAINPKGGVGPWSLSPSHNSWLIDLVITPAMDSGVQQPCHSQETVFPPASPTSSDSCFFLFFLRQCTVILTGA